MPMYLSDTKFPRAEDVSERGLSLPSFPALDDGDIERVVGLLKSARRV
jgi:perosamine synthetase